MYLSRLDVNLQRRDARRLLSSPQRVHAAVLAAFPEAEAEAEADRGRGRVLWRLDEASFDSVLYVVSPFRPDLTHLVETVGRPSHGWQTREYGPFLDRLSAGDRWAFRLRANPVRNVRGGAGGRGKRLAHVTADQQGDWLLRQAERHGFVVSDGSAGAPDLVVRARRTFRFDRAGRSVTLVTAVFEGTMRVVEPDALRSGLATGIGPGKGYGCGLLTLAAA